MRLPKWLASLGSGLLYAGAAVGVSHLVQSTRAGGEYGWDLLWAVVAANIFKYPFFEFGPRYAIATGQSLLAGYYNLGKWAFGIFALITGGTMFTIQAAVTLVNAGLLGIIIGADLPVDVLAFAIMLVCAFLLISGGYQILAQTIKWVVILLTITTTIALTTAILHFDSSQIEVVNFNWKRPEDVSFLIALMGWMPAPIDLSVWHSGWALAEKEANPRLDMATVRHDFHVGYWGTTLLGVMFLALGYFTLYGRGETMPAQSIPFAAKLISLYTRTIGDWSYPVITTAAFTTMFSTSLTVLDGYARTVVDGISLISPNIREKRWYLAIVMVTVLGAQGILSFTSGNMKSLVEFATIVSFVTAPILAGLNFWVMNREPVPPALRSPLWEWIIAGAGGIFLLVFTLIYLNQTLIS
ncbi:MAG: hypothetical protein CV045_11705 [Cyanobacteria bacterium M5B4]|nr:MAG: hypothetical protein CV045_11705 [Cyanobacteria bacterium M5B4]